MLSLSDQKVHALGQQQIVLKHYKYKTIKGDLLEAYLMKYKFLDYHSVFTVTSVMSYLLLKNKSKHLSSVL